LEVFALPAYVYRVRRPEPKKATVTPVVPDEPQPEEAAEPEVSYRDLQAQAKDLDIPANQSREELESAIAEAER
jgi:hypothetical protein